MRTKLIQLRGERPRMVVAQELEITPQMLGAIERGDRNPSLPLAKKIAEYYRVSMDDIFVDEVQSCKSDNGTFLKRSAF